jgi:GntR family transcriptional regulator
VTIDISPGGAAKYRQIADHLRTAIEHGQYHPGDALPSEAQLIEQFGVSRPTVRQAISLLRIQGLVDVEHGRGAFVRITPRRRRVSRNRYSQARLARRESAGLTSQITYAGPESAPTDIAPLFGIPEGAPIFIRRRTIFDHSGKPVQLSTSYFLPDLAEGTKLAQPLPINDMFRYIEQLKGRKYARAQEFISTRLPTPDEVTALKIDTNVPVLRVIHAAYDDQEEPLEVVDSIFPGDQHELYDEFEIE